MIAIDELRERVTGRELGTGTYRVEPYEAWLAHDAIGAPSLPAGTLHPLHVFVGGATGAGHTIEDVFALVECRPEDGPMLGEMEIAQQRALTVGETLSLRAVVLDVERKHGGSGTFDVMRVETSFTDEDGADVATLRTTFVYPRRS